jgi:hypothetical protein
LERVDRLEWEPYTGISRRCGPDGLGDTTGQKRLAKLGNSLTREPVGLVYLLIDFLEITTWSAGCSDAARQMADIRLDQCRYCTLLSPCQMLHDPAPSFRITSLHHRPFPPVFISHVVRRFTQRGDLRHETFERLPCPCQCPPRSSSFITILFRRIIPYRPFTTQQPTKPLFPLVLKYIPLP